MACNILSLFKSVLDWWVHHDADDGHGNLSSSGRSYRSYSSDRSERWFREWYVERHDRLEFPWSPSLLGILLVH